MQNENVGSFMGNRWIIAFTVCAFVIAIPTLILLFSTYSQDELSQFLGIPKEKTMKANYRVFLKKYGKNYPGDTEFNDNFARFKENYQFIQKYEKNYPEIKLEINEFGDKSINEIQGIDLNVLTSLKAQKIEEINKNLQNNWNLFSLENENMKIADLVLYGISLYYMKMMNKKIQISSENLIKCTKSNGENLGEIIDYLKNKGFSLIKENIDCEKYDGEFKANFYKIMENNFEQLKSALSKSPVFIGINTNLHEFIFYKDGILASNTEIFKNPNNLGLLLNFEYSPDTKNSYFVIQTTFGNLWKNSGIIKIEVSNYNFPQFSTYFEIINNENVNQISE